MQSFDTILYKHSPFLPTASQESLVKIGTNINVHKLPPIIAIAKEVGLAGTAQNQIHQDEFDWISDGFGATVQNIDDFMLGFVIPPTLILGGYSLKTHGIIDAIKIYCPPTEDPDLQKFNGYKSFHLFNSYNIIASTINRLPLIGAKPIYKLCKTEVFKEDFYFLAGIEASENLFTEISNLLYPF